MAKLIAEMTMSLDGFIALPDDTIGGLFDWYDNGPVEVPTARPDMTWHVSEASAEHLRRTMSTAGALLVGRRIFDITHGWDGQHPIDCPIVVLSHSVPDGWPRDGVPYTFVTSGFQEACPKPRNSLGTRTWASPARTSSGRRSTPASSPRSASTWPRGCWAPASGSSITSMPPR